MILNYDELAKEYVERLFSTLRNFTPGPPFLDTWVHDENHERSIYGIFEAAENAKLNSLSLVISQSVCQQVNLSHLNQELSQLGHVSVVTDGAQTKIEMEFKHG
jgi:hypothetical protein